jgi:hypothetical protein
MRASPNRGLIDINIMRPECTIKRKVPATIAAPLPFNIAKLPELLMQPGG